MKVIFTAEANVATYNIVVDGAAPVSFTPDADGSGTYDDGGAVNAIPGDHAVMAEACNAAGCSPFCQGESFNIPEPLSIPGVPVITVQV